MTLEKILFGALIASPVIASIFIIGRLASEKKQSRNDASYFSFWLLVLVLGIAFDLFGFLGGHPGNYKIGYVNTWHFIVNLNLWFIKVPFLASFAYSFFNINSEPDKNAEDEIAKFFLNVAWPTALAVFVWYVVLPIVNYAQ